MTVSSVHVGAYKIPVKYLVLLSSGLLLMLAMTPQAMPTTPQSLAYLEVASYPGIPRVRRNVGYRVKRVLLLYQLSYCVC